MKYIPPTPDDLDRLKEELGYSSSQMADLFGVATGRQFRRYTSKSDDTTNKRDMGMHMLFFAMARLQLSPREVEDIVKRMRAVGATVDLSAQGGAPEQ
jgi:hypothetical protein